MSVHQNAAKILFCSYNIYVVLYCTNDIMPKHIRHTDQNLSMSTSDANLCFDEVLKSNQLRLKN